MLSKFLTAADRGLAKLEQGMLAIAIVAIMATAVIVLIGIGSREVLPFRIPDDTTIVEQLMVVSIVFGLGYVTAQRAHIAIDLFYTHFSAGFQRLCDGLALVAGMIAFVPLTYWAYHDVAKLFRTGRYYYGELQMLEWPTRAVFLFGFMVLSLRLILMFTARLTGAEIAVDDTPDDPTTDIAA